MYADSCAYVSISLVYMISTYLICDLPRHVPLGPLQRPKGFTEVELNVITFTLHTYPQ